MNSDKDNMLKDDQDNTQTRETMGLYMWGEQNNHGKIKVVTLRQAR